MYHKIAGAGTAGSLPVLGAANGGMSVGLIVLCATLAAAGGAVVTLLPKLRRTKG